MMSDKNKAVILKEKKEIMRELEMLYFKKQKELIKVKDYYRRILMKYHEIMKMIDKLNDKKIFLDREICWIQHDEDVKNREIAEVRHLDGDLRFKEAKIKQSEAGEMSEIDKDKTEENKAVLDMSGSNEALFEINAAVKKNQGLLNKIKNELEKLKKERMLLAGIDFGKEGFYDRKSRAEEIIKTETLKRIKQEEMIEEGRAKLQEILAKKFNRELFEIIKRNVKDI